MKTIVLFALITLNYSLSAQVCNADFSYTISNNNVVTFTDSSTYSCSNPPWNGLYQSYDFGDPNSGRLNTFYPFGGNERKHFYKYPGVYTVCTYLFHTGTCVCNDSTCKQITIANTGSNCNAKYCYSATDTNGFLEAILINTSGSDDPIINVYWDFNDGSQSVAYHEGHSYFIPVADQLTYLYIQTQSGCQSVVLDTIKSGTNCSAIPAGTPGQALSLLEGCWRWDYYGGGIAGLPPTPAWDDIRLEFSRDAQDSLNGTISFRTFVDSLAVDSGRTSVWIDSNYLAWFVMDDVLARAFGFSFPPFPPIYFQDNNGAIEFTHFDISDDFYYGFVRDTCVVTTPTPSDKVDSVIALIKGCWRFDFYGGGLAGLPPTPTAGTISLRLDQDAQDSLNQTVSFWNYVNGILADSGRATLSLIQPGSSYYSFTPDIISSYNFIYFEHYDDTMIFTHAFPDEFYYGYVKDTCSEITIPADTSAVIDSVINILNGCWQWDHYFGGFPQIPPTPAWSDVKIEFSQNAIDSLNHTVTGESYLNDTLEFSGTCNVVADTFNIGYYTLSCHLFDSIGIVGWPPLIFNFEGDTLLFPQQSYVDGYVYGFLKGCDDTLINGTKFPKDIQVSIYPNPASDKIIIEVENDQRVKILMYDLIGKQIEEYQDVRGTTEVDVSNIPDGIYFISIETERGLLTKKIVITR